MSLPQALIPSASVPWAQDIPLANSLSAMVLNPMQNISRTILIPYCQARRTRYSVPVLARSDTTVRALHSQSRENTSPTMPSEHFVLGRSTEFGHGTHAILRKQGYLLGRLLPKRRNKQTPIVINQAGSFSVPSWARGHSYLSGMHTKTSDLDHH